MFHRGPKPMAMEPMDIAFRFASTALGDDGSALFVDVEHESIRLFLAVAKEFLEYIGNIGHQVDGVIPHHDHPRAVGFNPLLD